MCIAIYCFNMLEKSVQNRFKYSSKMKTILRWNVFEFLWDVDDVNEHVLNMCRAFLKNENKSERNTQN